MVEPKWLLRQLGNQFQILIYAESEPSKELLSSLAELDFKGIRIEPIVVSHKDMDLGSVKSLKDKEGLFKQRFDAKDGTVYLIRPDQHVAWRGDAWPHASVGQTLAGHAGCLRT